MAEPRGTGRSAGHVAANFGAWMAAALASLIYVAVCSRVFNPATIGGYAAGVMLETIAYLAVGSGLTVAVQLRAGLDQLEERQYMGRAILAGLITAALLLAVADFWAQLWDAPEAAQFTRIFAVVALVHAAAQVALGTLRGRGQHRDAAAATAFAGVGAAALGVVPVLITREPLTLVASNVFVPVLLLVAASRRGVSLVPKASRSLAEGRFAMSTVLLNVVNFVAYNSAAWSVSRYISVATLGLYSRTWLLADLPAQGMASAATQALFPSFARMPKDSRSDLATDALACITAVSAVLLAGIAALASVLVPLLLGDAWRDAIPLLALLGIALAAMPPQWLLTSLLQGREEFRRLVPSRALAIAVAAVFAALVAATKDPLIAAAGAGAVQAAAYGAGLFAAAGLGLVQVSKALREHLATAFACAPLWFLAALQAAGIWQPRSVVGIAALMALAALAAAVAVAATLRGRTGHLLVAEDRLPKWVPGFARPKLGAAR